MATPRKTHEGQERGTLLLGPLTPGGKPHLFTVTRVRSAHSVEAICNTGAMVIEVEISTRGWLSPESEWRTVRYETTLGDVPPEKAAGYIVRRWVCGSDGGESGPARRSAD